MYSVVTSGIGVYGPNIRVGTNSEVVIIDIDFKQLKKQRFFDKPLFFIYHDDGLIIIVLPFAALVFVLLGTHTTFI